MAQINNPTPEDLRTEYQVCQAETNRQSASFWSFAGIFLGLSVAGFGIIVPEIFNPHNSNFKVFITIIGLLMIVIYFLLTGLLYHINKRNRRTHERMREIETERGMNIWHRQENIEGIGATCYWWLIITILSFCWIVAIIFAHIGESA